MKKLIQSIVAVGLLLSVISTALAKPLKVYILAGQSNMEGHAAVRTFDHVGMDPKTAPLLEDMRNADGTPLTCDKVWISYLTGKNTELSGKLTAGYGAQGREPKIGPEYLFGITMDKIQDEPILLIKTAWGGKSLHTDFRPPSAGPYVFNKAELERFEKQKKNVDEIKAKKAEATGHYYRLMMNYVEKVLGDIKSVCPDYDQKAGYELAGFVWFQGWNDMVASGTYPNRSEPGGYDAYSEALAHFIRDVRKDLSAPKLPFVIGVMGTGGPTALYGPDQQRYKTTHQGFRDAMAAPAAMPEFKGNVAAVLTETCWDLELTKLKNRESTLKRQIEAIRQKVREKELSKDEGAAAQDKLYSETFTERELTVLKTGVSNAGYHYMGSAKIMAQIGKGFAGAMAELSGAEPSPRP